MVKLCFHFFLNWMADFSYFQKFTKIEHFSELFPYSKFEGKRVQIEKKFREISKK